MDEYYKCLSYRIWQVNSSVLRIWWHTCTCTCMIMDNQAQCFLTSISFQWLSKAFLKLLIDVESTTCCGRLFQSLTTRLLKQNFLTSSLDRCLQTFILCVRRPCSFLINWKNWMLLILFFPLSILYVSIKSPLVLLLCKVVRPSLFTLLL